MINGLWAQDLSFYRENISMKIDRKSFYVNGTYYLRGEGMGSKALVYPLPQDSVYGKVDSLFIYNITTQSQIIPLKTEDKKVVFKVDFAGHDEIVLQISYKQKLLGNKAEYILESTLSWKKPFEQVNYQLIVSSGLKIDSFSIPPNDSLYISEEMIYYWDRGNFMPSKNLVFTFKRE